MRRNSEFANDRYELIDSFKRSRNLNRFNIFPSEKDSSAFNPVKLNKKKKYELEERRNTEIDRQNRILYEKIARCARKSQPSSINNSKTKHRVKTISTQPQSPQVARQHLNKRNKVSKANENTPEKVITLFLGHNYIDGVQFKIKIVVANRTYHLIGKNEFTNIVLEMDEDEYWQLHYGQLNENPCNIFKYLQIEKGRLQFRVQGSKKRKKTRQREQLKFPKV